MTKSGPHFGDQKGTKNGTQNRAKKREKMHRNAATRKQAWSKKRSNFVHRRLGSRSLLVSSDPSPMHRLSLKLATCW